jgi:3-oxoacyl-[acyl-carrier-protein] synthase III
VIGALRSTAGLVSIGAAVPERVVTNDELSSRIDTTDAWIRERTGIAERRVAAPDVWASDLGLAAAQQALDRSGLAPAEIDIVIAATCSPDAYFPSIAATIADGLGAHSAAANDISAACTGWVYALMNAVTQIESGLAQHVLVVGAETLSKIIDWDDRGTCILFGDGAGACVMSAGALPETVFGLELGADGSRGNDLVVGALRGTSRIEMDGAAVFRFATTVMVDSARRVLDVCGIGIDDVDWIVPHQANVRIIDNAVKRLGADPSRVLVNLERYGNTSAASIPLCLEEAWSDGRLKKGDRVLMVGFGGGLTWGSCLTEWAGDGPRGGVG